MKALIAMSGGVDSSVAAYLIKEQGFDCVGATMKLFGNDVVNGESGCCSLDDVFDARAVADSLGFPHYVFNFAERFREEVIDRFVRAYETGRTPNPCIDCNRYLKFEELFRRAAEIGCDRVVTGHYARIEKNAETGRYFLKKAVDQSKDQSYVLYSLTQEQLGRTLFPLGELTKEETRSIAEAQGFVNAKKRDSQDICFVQNESYADFIERITGKSYPPGDFIDSSGRVLGRHNGIIRYTVGQRRGLGVPSGERLYVTEVNPEANTVTLSEGGGKYSGELIADGINLMVPSIEKPMRVKAKIRYRQKEQWATAIQLDNDLLSVRFDEPQRAITPGQAVVLYDGDIVVGGGTIKAATANREP